MLLEFYGIYNASTLYKSSSLTASWGKASSGGKYLLKPAWLVQGQLLPSFAFQSYLLSSFSLVYLLRRGAWPLPPRSPQFTDLTLMMCHNHINPPTQLLALCSWAGRSPSSSGINCLWWEIKKHHLDLRKSRAPVVSEEAALASPHLDTCSNGNMFSF